MEGKVKVLVGMVTYGNPTYTRMALHALQDAMMLCDKGYVIYPYAVVGKPGDGATVSLLEELSIPYIKHKINKGFPASLNDLMDIAFGELGCDYFISVGNDVLVHPLSLNIMLNTAVKDGYHFLGGIEVTPQKLCNIVDIKYKFDFENNTKFLETALPEWNAQNVKLGSGRKRNRLEFGVIGDTHNFALFSKEMFNQVGYVDVNFFPAYFEDNDYGRRMQYTQLKQADSNDLLYFHFWSRTLYEGGTQSLNKRLFDKNEEYYITKWGGKPGKETWSIPFNNKPKVLNGVNLPNSIGVYDRGFEGAIIDYWSRV